MSIDGATTFIADEPEPRADVVRLQLQMLASVELEHVIAIARRMETRRQQPVVSW